MEVVDNPNTSQGIIDKLQQIRLIEYHAATKNHINHYSTFCLCGFGYSEHFI